MRAKYFSDAAAEEEAKTKSAASVSEAVEAGAPPAAPRDLVEAMKELQYGGMNDAAKSDAMRAAKEKVIIIIITIITIIIMSKTGFNPLHKSFISFVVVPSISICFDRATIE